MKRQATIRKVRAKTKRQPDAIGRVDLLILRSAAELVKRVNHPLLTAVHETIMPELGPLLRRDLAPLSRQAKDHIRRGNAVLKRAMAAHAQMATGRVGGATA